MAAFRPNIYPIMFQGLVYGVAAGLLLWVVSLLANYIGLVWAPFFLAGMIWGGYRNYRKQKTTAGGVTAGTPLQEFQQAVSDIADASQGVFNQDAGITAQGDIAPDYEIDENQQPNTDIPQQPPVPPT